MKECSFYLEKSRLALTNALAYTPCASATHDDPLHHLFKDKEHCNIPRSQSSKVWNESFIKSSDAVISKSLDKAVKHSIVQSLCITYLHNHLSHSAQFLPMMRDLTTSTGEPMHTAKNPAPRPEHQGLCEGEWVVVVCACAEMCDDIVFEESC